MGFGHFLDIPNRYAELFLIMDKIIFENNHKNSALSYVISNKIHITCCGSSDDSGGSIHKWAGVHNSHSVGIVSYDELMRNLVGPWWLVPWRC